MTPERRSLLDKVRKLLALAEGRGATPAESATAATQAARILERHKLDRAELDLLEADPEEVSDDTCVFEGVKLASWIRVLGAAIAETSDCMTLIARAREGPIRVRLQIIGRPSDVQAVSYLFAYCRREIDRLANDALRDGMISGAREASNFRIGAAYEILHRLRSARAAERSWHSSRAIVRVDDRRAALDEFLGKRQLKIAPKPSVHQDFRAQRAGYLAASSIALETDASLPAKPAAEIGGKKP